MQLKHQYALWSIKSLKKQREQWILAGYKHLESIAVIARSL